MDNHNGNFENDAQKPGASWVGLLAGMLISLLIGGLTGALGDAIVRAAIGEADTSQNPPAERRVARAGG